MWPPWWWFSRNRNICRGFLDDFKKPYIGFLNIVDLVGSETFVEVSFISGDHLRKKTSPPVSCKRSLKIAFLKCLFQLPAFSAPKEHRSWNSQALQQSSLRCVYARIRNVFTSLCTVNAARRLLPIPNMWEPIVFWTSSKRQLVHNIIHHRQNVLEFIWITGMDPVYALLSGD